MCNKIDIHHSSLPEGKYSIICIQPILEVQEVISLCLYYYTTRWQQLLDMCADQNSSLLNQMFIFLFK